MAKELKWNAQKGQYELANFTSTEQAKQYIDSIAKTDLEILNDEDYRIVYQSRTKVNSEQRDVATARKQATAIILSLFEPTLKEIEQYCISKSNELTAKLNAYKPPKEREKKSFKLEATFDNQKALEKVRAYAIKYGATIKEVK